MILAEDIAMVLEDAYWLGNDAARGRREADSSMLIARGYTERIMALIAESMLSDEVYEATARKVVAEDPSNAATWEALSPYMQEVMVAYARSHAIAALAAAGITTTD